ncbi:MAG: outer membrane lipoprotein carrier protein LolA [Bacteroidota bacterium]|nr:outer membrane lipoprotein carrier protein LolA [Bacteroidota bacterium]
MIKKVLIVFFLYINVCYSQTSVKGKNLLDQVSEKMGSYSSIQFEFSYVLNNRKEQINQESYGKITVSKDLYKLDFLDATQLYDGKSIYTIVPENEEITITNPEEELNEYTISPSYLLNFYKDGYDYQWDIKQYIREKNIQFIKLIPVDENTDIQFLLIGVDIDLKHLFRIIEIGNNGTQTTLTIEKMETNVSLPENYFEFNKNNFPNFYIIE